MHPRSVGAPLALGLLSLAASSWSGISGRSASNKLLAEAARQGTKGDLKKAASAADRAARIDPNNAMAHVVRGIVLRKQGNDARALEELDKAIRLDPKLAVAYCQRAFAHQQSDAEGSMDKALDDASRAIALDPSLSLPFLIRGNALVARGRFADAISDYDRAIERNPRSYSAYGCRAIAHASLGDGPAARRDIEIGLRLNPPRPDREQMVRFRDELLRRQQARPAPSRSRGRDTI